MSNLCFTNAGETHTLGPRPAFDAFRLTRFPYITGVSLVPSDSTETAPPASAATIHELKSLISVHHEEPSRALIWRHATLLQQHLTRNAPGLLVVPSGISWTKKTDKETRKTTWKQERGKKGAAHVRHKITDPDRWTLQDATNQRRWWGDPRHAEVVGLGIFLFASAIVLDFDHLDEEAKLARFEELHLHFPDAPMEVTRNGAHAYFLSTPYSRQHFPNKTSIDKIDVLTAFETGTPFFIAVAPSQNKRWVGGRRLGDTCPMKPIPDALVDALVTIKASLTPDKAPRITGVKRERSRPDIDQNALVNAINTHLIPAVVAAGGTEQEATAYRPQAPSIVDGTLVLVCAKNGTRRCPCGLVHYTDSFHALVDAYGHLRIKCFHGGVPVVGKTEVVFSNPIGRLPTALWPPPPKYAGRVVAAAFEDILDLEFMVRYVEELGAAGLTSPRFNERKRPNGGGALYDGAFYVTAIGTCPMCKVEHLDYTIKTFNGRYPSETAFRVTFLKPVADCCAKDLFAAAPPRKGHLLTMEALGATDATVYKELDFFKLIDCNIKRGFFPITGLIRQ